ncbi:hypothetical protein [Lactobacillus acetotolerans]|uniref:hypothetical protein n=1 Tax=Lactobacillus acetotolerans TaxID=1600 RepID=UPI00241F3994|nr:hypothetical protein [Lactobacillus acetotolerans]
MKSSSELAIDGRFLIKQGIEPGPKLGKMLNTIKEKVIAGELENNEEAIGAFVAKQD